MIESPIFPLSEHIQTLGWVLLNFIWQGLLLAVVLKGLLSGMRWCSAALRYNVAIAVLLAIFIIPVTSFLKPHLLQPDAQPEKGLTAIMPYSVEVMPGDRHITDIDDITGMEDPTVHGTKLLVFFQHILPWVSALWFAGVLAAFLRTSGGLIKVLQLKRGAKNFTGEIDLPALAQKLGIRKPVRLLETIRVTVPSVIGWFRPVILLPEGNRFSPEQVEALIAHELAHVRRRDHWVNLFQAIVESLLFFHPAVWWVSSQVRIERESCCDDAAISVCRNVKTYVRSLTEAERHRSVSKWAVAVSGASLLNRIRRITDMKKKPVNRFASWSAMIFGVSLILVVASASSLLAFIPEPFHTPVDSSKQTSSEQEEVESRTYPLSHAPASEAAQALEVTLSEQPGNPVIKVDTETNSLIVAGTEKDDRKNAELIKELDIPSNQTMVEVESMIMEIPLSELERFGAVGSTRIYSPEELVELRDKIQSGRIKAKILSNPKLLTLNKKESRISTGGKVHYMEKAGDGLFRPKALETPIGIQLSITPTILDKRIGMDINLQVNDISGRLAVTEYPDLNIGKPTIRSREHTTNVVIKDGDTVLIGGMKNPGSKEDNGMFAFITASIANR